MSMRLKVGDPGLIARRAVYELSDLSELRCFPAHPTRSAQRCAVSVRLSKDREVLQVASFNGKPAFRQRV
jgi:hypothetical protein